MTDQEAYERHEGLIIKIASEAHRRAVAQGKRIPLDDIVQTAWLGFFHGKRRWSPNKGANLCTYCALFAKGHVSRMVWGPARMRQKHWEENAVQPSAEFFHNVGVENLDDTAIAEYLEGKPDTVVEVVTLAIHNHFKASKIARIQGMLIGDVIQILVDAAAWFKSFEK